MNYVRILGRSASAWLVPLSACAVLLAGACVVPSMVHARNAMPQGGPPPNSAGRRLPPAKPFPLTLTVTDGTSASYRVREQLAGVNFPNDAVGTSTSVTGTIVFSADGSIDSSKSKLVFDLRTLKSDQQMRDGFIQKRTLETDQYPDAVFVPKTIEGMPHPLDGQFGFELTGDMTIHGTTAPITWQGIATVNNRDGMVAGRATTNFKFETFGLMPPKIFRVLRVDDNIGLEIEFKLKTS